MNKQNVLRFLKFKVDINLQNSKEFGLQQNLGFK